MSSHAVCTWAITWKYLKSTQICPHDVTQESIVVWTDNFTDVFVWEKVALYYDMTIL